MAAPSGRHQHHAGHRHRRGRPVPLSISQVGRYDIRIRIDGFADANVTAINARLAATGYPGSPVTTRLFPTPVRSTHYLGKIDHQAGRTDHVSVRYSLYDVS